MILGVQFCCTFCLHIYYVLCRHWVIYHSLKVSSYGASSYPHSLLALKEHLATTQTKGDPKVLEPHSQCRRQWFGKNIPQQWPCPLVVLGWWCWMQWTVQCGGACLRILLGSANTLIGFLLSPDICEGGILEKNIQAHEQKIFSWFLMIYFPWCA